jgi:hypothetical protein
MKYPKPSRKEEVSRSVYRLSPILERLFLHASNHPNDMVAQNLLKGREKLYQQFLDSQSKKKET